MMSSNGGGVIDNPLYQNTNPVPQTPVAHQNSIGSNPSNSSTTSPVNNGMQESFDVFKAQMASMDASYQNEDATLIAQFEKKRMILAANHANKMNEQYQLIQKQAEYAAQTLALQKQKETQQAIIEAEQKRLQEVQRQEMNKSEGISSNEVRRKLRGVLLSKTVKDPASNVPVHWNQTQHLSFERQHSPTSSSQRGRSPPLQKAFGCFSRFDEAYPLRKAASEPNLKVRLALKQKMMERRTVGSTLHRQQVHRRTGAINMSTNKPRLISNASVETSISPESGPSSPHSQFSAENHIKEVSDTIPAFPLQLMSKMVINQSMPNISFGPRPPVLPLAPDIPIKSESPNQNETNEAEIRARAAVQHGHPLTQHMLTGKLPMYPSLMEIDPQLFHTPFDLTAAAAIAAAASGNASPEQESIIRSIPTTNTIPVYPGQSGPSNQHSPPIMITDSLAAQARLNRRPLNRTNSAPLPLPGQLIWTQQQRNKESQKLYLKQKLQATIFQKSQSKAHMEQVNESFNRDMLEGKDDVAKGLFRARRRKRQDDDAIYSINEKSSSQSNLSVSNTHEAFLKKLNEQVNRPASQYDRLRPLERTMSSPLVTSGHNPMRPVSDEQTSMTGLAYDEVMLKHTCMCGNETIHPENPTRLKAVHSRIIETGLGNKCRKLRCEQASMEELQTCHSEAYTLIYGTSPQKFSAKLFEVLSPRFCKLPCTGIGVDTDTVWNNDWTPISTRMAVGCIIELVINIAQSKIQNGLALVRPPGHHAEPTLPMGFCYFNGVAIATKILLDRYKLKRVLIIDWDVHHGNSTQQIFYADPRVLFISIHRHDNGNFFPGTGQPSETGIEKGEGFNINIGFSGKLNPPMGDAEYIAAFRTIIMPIAREFDPEIVLISAGFDAAVGHSAPLGGYNVSPACFGHMTKQVMTLAEGRIAMALEGGYDINSMCDSTEMCLRALLGEEIPLLEKSQICISPNSVAIEDIKLTISHHLKYWNCLRKYVETVEFSLMEAQQRERDEMETVKAFASLSVLPNSIAVMEPMDEQ